MERQRHSSSRPASDLSAPVFGQSLSDASGPASSPAKPELSLSATRYCSPADLSGACSADGDGCSGAAGAATGDGRGCAAYGSSTSVAGANGSAAIANG